MKNNYPPVKMEQTVFRNVGIKNSDTGELPRRKHTTKYHFFTRSKNIIAVYSDNQMKQRNTLCQQNVEVVIIVAGYTVP